MEKKVKIDQELVTRIERCHYEYNALLNVEKAYLDDHMLDQEDSALTSKVFEKFHSRTVAALKEYEEAKTEMVKEYGLESVVWNLDFATGEVTVG